MVANTAVIASDGVSAQGLWSARFIWRSRLNPFAKTNTCPVLPSSLVTDKARIKHEKQRTKRFGGE